MAESMSQRAFRNDAWTLAASALFALKEDTGCICVELVKKLQKTDARFEQVGVKHTFRAYAHSQFSNVPRIFRMLARPWRLWVKLVVKTNFGVTRNEDSARNATEMQ